MNFEKILGQYWDKTNDVLRYKLKHTPCSIISKREMLAYLMKIYDPLGLAANYTTQAKVIIQEIWKTELDWDSPVPERIMEQWQRWKERIKELEHIQIPRCYSVASNIEVTELHTFVDASEKAFAAVVYLRTLTEKGIDVNIVAAKTRVAPIKPLSIPKLELQAAVLGVRLAETVKEELRITTDRDYYWSDSKTVLGWINADPQKYKQFVAVRIGEILDTTNASQWKWVSSESNPADEATKVVTRKSIWLNGPVFLKQRKLNIGTPS